MSTNNEVVVDLGIDVVLDRQVLKINHKSYNYPPSMINLKRVVMIKPLSDIDNDEYTVVVNVIGKDEKLKSICIKCQTEISAYTLAGVIYDYHVKVSGCGKSITSDGFSAYGRGKLDSNGFWSTPCYCCARRAEQVNGENSRVWPSKVSMNTIPSYLKKISK